MKTNSDGDVDQNDTQSNVAPRTYARNGALIGCVLGLLAAWRIMSGAIDPTVTDHSPMFPAAVMVVCIFTIGVVVVMTLVGLAIGACSKQKLRPPHNDSRQQH